ncbi:TPA: hypothetical protein ACG3NN_002843 [Legionella pneumophila]
MIAKIKCLFGYHAFYTIKELTLWSRKIGCKRCNKQYAMHDDLKIILPWDEDFERLYKELGVL